MNSFKLEQQLKATESTIKNKIIDSLSELRGFKILTKLVLEFKKIESDNETKYSIFCSNLKAQTTINEKDTDDVSNQFILRLYQRYINILEKVRVGLLLQS